MNIRGYLIARGALLLFPYTDRPQYTSFDKVSMFISRWKKNNFELFSFLEIYDSYASGC